MTLSSEKIKQAINAGELPLLPSDAVVMATMPGKAPDQKKLLSSTGAQLALYGVLAVGVVAAIGYLTRPKPKKVTL